MNDVPNEFRFRWDERRARAAILLAEGRTQKEVAEELEITDRAVRKWLVEPEFAAEVDRLSLMLGIASRAERLRVTNRVIRQFVKEAGITTQKDLLEWLKYAQSETDGVKLDLGRIAAAFGADEASMAGGRQAGTGEAESEAVN